MIYLFLLSVPWPRRQKLFGVAVARSTGAASRHLPFADANRATDPVNSDTPKKSPSHLPGPDLNGPSQPPPAMASPAVVAHQVNGLAATSRPDSPASINSSTKRKREDSDDGDIHLNSDKPTNQPVDGLRTSPDGKLLIRDFFDVLARYAPCHPQTLCCVGRSIASVAVCLLSFPADARC